MSRMTIIRLLGLVISLTGFGMMMSEFSSSGLKLPTLMDRPDYVPATAVQRIAAKVWFDCSPAADGQPNHFEITIYDGDTAHVRLQKNFFDNPEIVGGGTFELSGPLTSLEDLRRLFRLYDGEMVYLKNGQTLQPLYSLSRR